MSSSEGYILNAVSQAGPMWVTWKAIDNGGATREDLEAATALTKNQLGTTLRGLTYLRMIEQVEEYNTFPLSYGDQSDRLNFAMTALNNVAQECSVPPKMGAAADDQSDWGKQAVIPLTLEYFIDTQRQYFNRKKNTDLADMIDSWQQNLNYHPLDDSGERNDLNANKLDNWTRIADSFGFVREANGTHYTVYLSPTLIQRLIVEGAKELPNEGTSEESPTIDIRDWLGWVSRNFFRVSLTRDNQIPSILAQTLVELSTRDQIRLTETTDADSVGLEGISNPQSMDTAANCIKVIE